MNGLLLNSGLFDRVWVQPASHDAGAALGAALHVYHEETGEPVKSQRLEHVYWGSDIGSATDV
jgi:carbamoyltransferase